MFKELFESQDNEEKQLFKEVETVLIHSGIQPPKDFSSYLTLRGDTVFVKLVTKEVDSIQELKLKLWEYTKKQFSVSPESIRIKNRFGKTHIIFEIKLKGN